MLSRISPQSRGSKGEDNCEMVTKNYGSFESICVTNIQVKINVQVPKKNFNIQISF